MYMSTLSGKEDFWHKADPTDIRRRLDKKYPGARQGVATAVAAVFPKARPYVATGLLIDEYTDKRRRERLEKEEIQRIKTENAKYTAEEAQHLQEQAKAKPANWLIPATILILSMAG